MPARRCVPLVALALPLALALAACTSPRLDQAEDVRHPQVPLDPWFAWLFEYDRADSGESYQWSTLLWTIGHSRENETTHTRVFPFWWSNDDPPYSSSRLLFPLYYGRDSEAETARFYSLLYGYTETDTARTDWVLPPIFHWRRSRTSDSWGSSLLFVYDWQHDDGSTSFTLAPILGLAHLFQGTWGLPPDGGDVPALGREHSRRFELLNLLGIVSLFGYDDVGDRREIRLLTLFSNEVMSPIRSWRGRGEDPFVREWLFPLYMNVQDEDDGWMYVGPLWGTRDDRLAGTHTDWWLLGLVSRRTAPEGVSWSLAGLTVSGPDGEG